MNKSDLNLLEKGLFFALGISPLFLVTVRSWTNALLILTSIISFLLLTNYWLRSSHDQDSEDSSKKILFLFTLLAPIFAVAIGSILRGKFIASDYDSAARFLIASSVFLFALRNKFNFSSILQYSAPASLIITLIHQIIFPQPNLWGVDRMATYFADPLVFGYTSLTLGLISLASINLLKIDGKLVVLFKITGALIGLYLSIKSGSRTGWLGFPIIIAILFYLRLQNKGKKLHFTFASIAIGLILTIGLFASSKTISDRIYITAHEITNYSWSGIAPDTSIGMRITFLRLAADLLVANPWTGYGDTKLSEVTLPSHISTYASPASIHMALNSGFHNEIVTNAIRNGFTGLLSSLMLFTIPLLIFLKKLKSTCKNQKANSLLGIVFTLCVFISSMSTEVFDLKYMASFYALMISLLTASSIATYNLFTPSFVLKNHSDFE
jgi:O-antigen ligase